MIFYETYTKGHQPTCSGAWPGREAPDGLSPIGPEPGETIRERMTVWLAAHARPERLRDRLFLTEGAGRQNASTSLWTAVA